MSTNLKNATRDASSRDLVLIAGASWREDNGDNMLGARSTQEMGNSPELLAALFTVEHMPDRLRKSSSANEPIIPVTLLLPFSVFRVPLKHLSPGQTRILAMGAEGRQTKHEGYGGHNKITKSVGF